MLDLDAVAGFELLEQTSRFVGLGEHVFIVPLPPAIGKGWGRNGERDATGVLPLGWVPPASRPWHTCGLSPARAAAVQFPVMFYADLHVHSRYSRATSRDCDLEHLALWAGERGSRVVGTGDFTHPGWFAEIAGEARAGRAGAVRRTAGRSSSAGDARVRLGRARTPVRRPRSCSRSRSPPSTRRPAARARCITWSTCPTSRPRGASATSLGADRQPRLRRPADPGARLPRPAGDHALGRARAATWCRPTSGRRGSPCSAPSRASTRSRMLRRPGRRGLRPGDRPVVRPADELAACRPWTATRWSPTPTPIRRPSSAARPASSTRRWTTSPCAVPCRPARATAARSSSFPRKGKYHLDGHRKCGVCLEPDETRRTAACARCAASRSRWA